MPSWQIHKKWALKLGIPARVTDYVNKLIDKPETCSDFWGFCSEKEEEWRSKKGGRRRVLTMPITDMVAKHDVGRRRRAAGYIQLEFLIQKGTDYVKAWFLHQALDYLKTLGFTGETLEKFRERRMSFYENFDSFDLCKELEEVLKFLKRYMRDISYDLEE